MNFNLKRHKKKSKRKKKGSRKQNNKVNTSAIEKGLSSLCIAKENKATEGATAKFLENSSDRSNLKKIEFFLGSKISWIQPPNNIITKDSQKFCQSNQDTSEISKETLNEVYVC